MTSLADLSAADLHRHYRRGELSPVEAVRATLDRIDVWEPVVNAFAFVDREGALAAARSSEARWRHGDALGPLDGVPVSVKDLLLMAGHPTHRGSWLVGDGGPGSEDSPATQRLRESGAVIVGKTTTPEFGWKGVTDSPRTGITRNPWDPDLTPGGSSGGSAAAVAVGMAPLSVGTDGGGSVRIPAAFTGTFALKPTYGRVPPYPATAFGNLSHVGPMARTVEDAAILLDVIARPDHRDWSSLPGASASWATSSDAGAAGLRGGYSVDLGYVEVDPEIAEIVGATVRALAEGGAHVEEVSPGFTDPVDAFHALWFSGAAGALAGFSDADSASLADPGLVEIADAGRRLDALDIVRATAVRADLGRRMGELHRRYDVLVTPTLPIAAFAAGQEVPPGSGMHRWTQWTPFTYPFNLTQQPAASVPCGLTSGGLPVGLQVVGPRFAEDLVLRVSRLVEEISGPHRPGSPPSGPT